MANVNIASYCFHALGDLFRSQDLVGFDPQCLISDLRPPSALFNFVRAIPTPVSNRQGTLIIYSVNFQLRIGLYLKESAGIRALHLQTAKVLCIYMDS